jgi:hypothetical protein
MKQLLITGVFIFITSVGFGQKKIWTAQQANAWYQKQGWLVGADFLPSTAINQLEMWQAATFDTTTIKKELGWASKIGMNVMRVYLHDLAWQADAVGFKNRMNQFLSIANKNKIKIIFCILDDCWNPEANIGIQPEPKPGVHNSGWVRSPTLKVHNDMAAWGDIEMYVKDILTSFKNDNRILLWDLYNEPGNSGYGLTSLPLLKKMYEWAWAIRPAQPLSTGVWFTEQPLINQFQIENSDVITFHNYGDTIELKKGLDTLIKTGRPVICTEYMARTNNSRFITHLPIFKRYRVAAINWGLVSGKSNTIFPWGSKPGSPEPTTWFHDVFRKDGTPYSNEEVLFIKKITKSN